MLEDWALKDWALFSGSSFTPSKAGQIHFGLTCAVLAAVSGNGSFAAIKAAQSAHFFWDTEKRFFSSKGKLLVHIYMNRIFFWSGQESTC